MFRIELSVDRDSIPDFVFVLEGKIPPGGYLRLQAKSGVSFMSTVRVESVSAVRPGQDRAAGKSPEELKIVHRYDRQEMQKNWGWYIRTRSMAVAACPDGLPQGTEIRVVVAYTISHRANDPAAGANRPRYSGLSWTMEAGKIASPKDEAFHPLAEAVELSFIPGEPVRAESYLKSGSLCTANTFDAYGNPTGHAVEVRSDRRPADEAAGSIPAVASEADSTGRVKVSLKGLEALSNARPVAMDGIPLWFGEIHWHTDFSGDGQRAMEAALASARDELCLDFAGPADHMEANGRYTHRHPREQADICRRFDDPGRFCTLPGAELSRRYGHCNIYADSWETFLEATSRMETEVAPAWANEANRYPFGPLAAICPEGKALYVPHHSNMDSFVREGVVREDSLPFWCAMHFPIPKDHDDIPASRIVRTARLFEIVQSRGAFETEGTDKDWRIWDGGLGGSARTALMRGYRMGFIAGTDNHCGWPTRLGSGYAGCTVIAAPRLDTASIFAGMDARRCYATSGPRIVADATLNGVPMGSEMRLAPGADRVIRISVHGTAALKAVQIVHCGYVLAEIPIDTDTSDLDTEWADERPGRPLENAWYYVRIRQADGHCAWLSPFWIDLAE